MLLPNNPQACRYWQVRPENQPTSERQQNTLFTQGRQGHFCRKPLKHRAFKRFHKQFVSYFSAGTSLRLRSKLVRAARSILRKHILLLTVASGQRVKFGSKAGFAAMN
jgi:hypothetical protein